MRSPGPLVLSCDGNQARFSLMDVKARKPWFRPNKSNPGWHPSSLRGGLTTGVIVAAMVTVVVLFRTGVL